jgi:thiol-disulfide isomerase/thioredoxin
MHAQDSTKIDLIFRNVDYKPDSIWFFSNGQGVHLWVPYADTVHVVFQPRTDDNYTIQYQAQAQNIQANIWLDTTSATVWLSKKGTALVVDTVAGSPMHDRVKKYLSDVKSLKDAPLEGLNNFLKTSMDSFYGSPLFLMIARSFISKNQNDKTEMRALKVKFEAQPEVIKQHFLYESTYNLVANKIKDVFDLESFNFLNNLAQSSKIDRGADSVIVLDFWFTNCPPCVAQHKVMKADFENNAWNTKVKLIGISSDQSTEKWQKYLLEHHLPWDNYLEIGDFDQRLSRTIGIAVYPTYLILNHKNEVLKSFNEYSEVKKYLKTK